MYMNGGILNIPTYVVSARDQAIIAARSRSLTFREIGEQFGVSGARAQNIVSKHQRGIRVQARAEELRAQILAANDLHKQWRTNCLLQALAFPFLPERAIKSWLQLNGHSELSLKQLMDYAVPEDPTLDAYGWVNSPATQQRGVGRKTYKALIKHLTGKDLGKRFNEEWRRRIKKLTHLNLIGICT